MDTHVFSAEKLRPGYDGRVIVNGMEVSIPDGKIGIIIGANGCGKSTLLAELNQTRGTTIVMVLHDINLSARYADWLFAMRKGKLLAQGKPGEILTPALMQEIYGLDCVIMEDPVSHTPYVAPKGRHPHNKNPRP